MISTRFYRFIKKKKEKIQCDYRGVRGSRLNGLRVSRSLHPLVSLPVTFLLSNEELKSVSSDCPAMNRYPPREMTSVIAKPVGGSLPESCPSTLDTSVRVGRANCTTITPPSTAEMRPEKAFICLRETADGFSALVKDSFLSPANMRQP